MAFSRIDSETALFRADEDLEQTHAKWVYAAQQVFKALNERPKSIVVELNVYRKYCPIVIDQLIHLTEVNKAAVKEADRVYNKINTQSHKRWTKEQDLALIDYVCQDGVNMAQVAAAFGRTPEAIKSRITYLVGVKKLSQAIAGRFIGTIDGIKTDAQIDGVVLKEAT